MKVSNHKKPGPGEKAVSRATLRDWQKRDIATQRKADTVRKRSGEPEKELPEESKGIGDEKGPR